MGFQFRFQFQFQNKYFKISISILSSLVLVSSFIVQSTIALDSRFQGFISINRRILHQPLFPENTAPPSPPPPPSPPDLPFFPEVPGGGSPDQGQEQQQTPPPPLNGVGNATVATTKKEKGSKTFVIGISIGIIISAILLLGLGFFFFYKFRMKESDESQNKFREILTPQESVLQPSNYLYVGTVEPVAERSVLENRDSNGSVHKRLSSVKMADRYRPSPELQPLPPLTKTPLPPPIADNSPFLVSSSDDEEEELESHESTFYTPQGSSLSNEEGCNSHFPTSNNKFRADNTPAVISSSSSSSVPLPHSKRTSPKSRFTTSPPENLNPIVNPPLKQSPEAPVQISKPTIPIPNIPIRPKFSTLPPPPDFARLQLINKQTHEISRGSIPPTPPPPLPPPPPPLPPAKEISTRTTQKVKNPQITSPTLQFGSKVEQLDCFEEEEEDNPLEKNNGNNGGDESRPKLKPLHWDKVRASSDRATVWDTLNSSSFQLNEDVMESLFGCESSTSIPKEVKKKSVMRLVESDKSVLDPKKSHNIAILLRALNVTRDEVSEALLDGNLEGLGPELLETLVKMAPTKEEEIKLRDYNGDTSKLGSAERFLKAILDIPLAFKRVDAMLYKANFDTEVNYLTKSFLMLEEASKELKNSKLFLKLLEAVLRTGNRMNVGTNRGDATSFKLDTLLKLADVKGTDGKTTLLHFVVQEIIKTEEIPKNIESNTRTQTQKDENLRKQGLHILAGLSKELENVKKAASMDSDVLSSYVSKLESGLEKIRLVLGFEKTGNEKGEFFESMKKFLNEAEESIGMIKLQEQKALDSVKEVTQYFHGDAAKEEAHPFRIFVIVRDFISILEKVCKEVGKIEDRSMVVGTSSSFRGTTSTSTTTLLPRISDYKNVRKDGSTSSDGFSP